MNKIYGLLTRNTKLAGDITIGICVILTGYFYYYENTIRIFITEEPANINYYFRIIIGIFIIITWLLLSLENGIKRRQSFLTSALCIWIIPQIIYQLIETFAPQTYSNEIIMRIILLLRHISSIINLSLSVLGDIIYTYTSIPYTVTLNCVIMCYIIMFVAGLIINKYNNIGELKDDKFNKTLESNSSIT